MVKKKLKNLDHGGWCLLNPFITIELLKRRQFEGNNFLTSENKMAFPHLIIAWLRTAFYTLTKKASRTAPEKGCHCVSTFQMSRMAVVTTLRTLGRAGCQ